MRISDMLWTTVGLVVGAAVAFVAALTEQNSPVLKRAILCIFAAAALVVGLVLMLQIPGELARAS
jgi:FtsH-binding integral membrane protein